FDFLFPLSAASGALNAVSANRQMSTILTGVFIITGFVCMEHGRLIPYRMTMYEIVAATQRVYLNRPSGPGQVCSTPALPENSPSVARRNSIQRSGCESGPNPN